MTASTLETMFSLCLRLCSMYLQFVMRGANMNAILGGGPLLDHKSEWLWMEQE